MAEGPGRTSTPPARKSNSPGAFPRSRLLRLTAYGLRLTACGLFHRDRHLHPQRDVRHAVRLVRPGGCAGERDVVLLVRLREERTDEVTHRVWHPLLQGICRTLGDRIGVEGDVMRAAGHVDEPHGCAGLNGQLDR